MDTGTGGRHAVPHDKADPRRGWDEQFNDYLRFVKEQQRVPSQYADDRNERALNAWFRNQKASLKNGLLLPERVITLDEKLPGWSSPYRVRPSWDQMLARVVDFRAEHGVLPSAMSPDSEERSLAHWLYRQSATRTARTDRRHAERAAMLDRVLPEWRNRPPGGNTRWNARLEEFLGHVRKHGKYPVMGASSPPEEYFLGKWIAVQRHAYKKGTLYPERAARLDELLPGWRRIG